MQGCSPQDFERKLKKLNKDLWVDHEKIAYPYHKDYPTCGLYLNTKFIMGVPQNFVPVYSVMGTDLMRLEKIGDIETLNYIDDYGFLPEGKNLEERILWRGAKPILASLARQGYIDEYKVSKYFGFHIYKKQMEYPRFFIQLDIN